MRCPTCGSELKIAERQGIEIDYCPQCRGVWLDRGELDKLIERTSAPAVPFQVQAQPQGWGSVNPAVQRYDHDDDDDDHYYRRPAPDAYGYPNQPYNNGYPYKKRKREGFLGELFDFD